MTEPASIKLAQRNSEAARIWMEQCRKKQAEIERLRKCVLDSVTKEAYREALDRNVELGIQCDGVAFVLSLGAAELQRLRDVHLPKYEKKIGEPDKEVLNLMKKALDSL